MIHSIGELKRSLDLSVEANEDDIKKAFEDIAKFLIEECVITYNERDYAFSNIEFYFFNRNHKDIITHPRRSEALQWYVNDFGGIDLNFKSWYEEGKCMNNGKKIVTKPILNDKCCFGGILIRGLMDCETRETMEGPYACAELFRLHSALGVCDFPKLEMRKSGMKLLEKTDLDNATGRHHLIRKNKTVKDKVENILCSYCKVRDEELIEEMCRQFEYFLKKPYWFRGEF